jgi:acetyltransferase-like isoleucine patch superfamily enzyme
MSRSERIQHIGEGVKLGKDVQIWNLTYIGNDTEIGDGTKVGSLVHIDYSVRIGAKCKIEGGVYIPPLTVIGDNVFVGPGVIFTNDPYPPSNRLVGTKVEDEVVIGAGSVIGPGLILGRGCVVGMGSVVTRDVALGTVVYGNPAKREYEAYEYRAKRERWQKNRPDPRSDLR